jgi:hypothetical protein
MVGVSRQVVAETLAEVDRLGSELIAVKATLKAERGIARALIHDHECPITTS